MVSWLALDYQLYTNQFLVNTSVQIVHLQTLSNNLQYFTRSIILVTSKTILMNRQDQHHPLNSIHQCLSIFYPILVTAVSHQFKVYSLLYIIPDAQYEMYIFLKYHACVDIFFVSCRSASCRSIFHCQHVAIRLPCTTPVRFVCNVTTGMTSYNVPYNL